MKKTNDWYFAGLIAGSLGGIAHILYNALLLGIGLQFSRTIWRTMAGLFYNENLLLTLGAQIHGMIDAVGVSAASGVLLSLVLLLTGKNHLHAKSISISASGAYFLYIAVFPQTGISKDSNIVPWISVCGYIIFNGFLVGYILNKICTYKNLKNK